MRKTLLATLLVSAALATGACKKSEPEAEPAATAEPAPQATAPATPPSAPATTPGDVAARRVAIEVGTSGYAPDRVEATPGEKLVLVFTRTADSECAKFVKVGDGEKTELPLGEPVEIVVTAPESGEVGFACGMDMLTGTIVANEG